MSGSQRLIVMVVAVLLLVGAAIVVARLTAAPPGANDPDVSAEPSPTPIPTTTAEASAPTETTAASASASAAPSAAASAEADEDLLAEIRDVEEQVAAIRGLAPAHIGPPDLITRAELADELERIFDEEYPAEDRERDNATLRALGLLDEDQDVAELQLQLLGDQVLGFYDYDEDRMVVVSDAGLDAAAKVTYAHEYTHALQDHAFDPVHFDRDAELDDDQHLALDSLTEGDAVVTMLAWAFKHLSQEELLEIGAGTPVPDTTGIPGWMIDQLAFPYTAGQVWVTALAGNDPLSPNFAAVDAAYEDPPESTEQVIDIDAWQAGEAPVEVDAPDLAAALGDEWKQVEDTTVGQATIDIVLDHFGVDDEEATEATGGWGGDRLTVATGPDGDFALAWRLAWDTPQDADQFLAAYDAVVDDLPFPALVRSVGERDVLVVHAATQELVDEVVAAAD